MSYATAAPGQQAGTLGSAPPTCQNCQTSTTPLWRRDESGSVLCNACGLFLKLHGRARPSSLKTDVIKSRNRVKTSSQGKLPKKNSLQGEGLAAAHPDLSSSPQIPSREQRHSQSHARLSDSILNPDSPFTRPDSPSTYRSTHREHHTANIAPQHLFDGATFDQEHVTNGFPNHSPYISQRNGSRSSLSPVNSHGAPGAFSSTENGPDESTTDLRTLLSSNTTLKTRVSELEVINELFRGRVTELESTEAEAQRRLDDALRREQELRSKFFQLEAMMAASSEDVSARPSKRRKLDAANGGEYPPEPQSTLSPDHDLTGIAENGIVH